jgi:hypothetical protein
VSINPPDEDDDDAKPEEVYPQGGGVVSAFLQDLLLSDLKVQNFEPDFYSMLILAYYRPNQEKYHISEKKQSELLVFAIIIYMIQEMIIMGQIVEAATAEDKKIVPAPDLYIFCVRFFGSMAL